MINPKPSRVLVVDDDQKNCELIQQILEREGFQVLTCNSGKEGLAAILKDSPKLVLLDQDMPGLTGLETLAEIRKNSYDVDVVFISANISHMMVSQALESGADDYLRKPFSLRELVSRVKVRFRLRALRDELKAANERLFELSQRDDVTGLYNMRSMYERIDQELKRCTPQKRHVACIMMDMDYFKSVNDGHDHIFGSFVLKEVGRILNENIRKVDFAARYGGDEFLVVLCDTNEEGTKIFTDRIHKTVQNFEFKDGTDQIRLTTSIGYSISSLVGETSARDLVRAADHALYEAKEKGRNQVCGFTAKEVVELITARRDRRKAA